MGCISSATALLGNKRFRGLDLKMRIILISEIPQANQSHIFTDTKEEP
jgi:hypothetical protein